ncbi:MAG TPA: four helix bundle protein [Balneolales bacterium]|nr:four helix bundle protein [Balneolales bacterium]
MKKENVLYDKSYEFSIKIIKLYKYLQKEKKEYTLSRQLLRCGTSIGANVAEANGAISEDDFSAKISIAYKECLETKYWLSLLKDTEYISIDIYTKLYSSADEIAKISYSILKKTRI